MREIKFRGKRKDDRRWVYGSLIISSNNRYWIITSANAKGGLFIGGRYEIIPETLGQFTGLYDKNGVEIYEGDILKVKVNMRKPVPENERQSQWDTVRLVPSYEKWTVEYCERYSQGNGFYCFGKDRRFNTHITKSKLYNTEAEIIGNIHDNPELLKGE